MTYRVMYLFLLCLFGLNCKLIAPYKMLNLKLTRHFVTLVPILVTQFTQFFNQWQSVMQCLCSGHYHTVLE
jgi:hypothetical protein